MHRGRTLLLVIPVFWESGIGSAEPYACLPAFTANSIYCRCNVLILYRCTVVMCFLCQVICDRDTGRSRGFAFVVMSTPEEAQKAMERFDGSVSESFSQPP